MDRGKNMPHLAILDIHLSYFVFRIIMKNIIKKVEILMKLGTEDVHGNDCSFM